MSTNANVNPSVYRSIMGLWPTGVSVVSGLSEQNEYLGMVIGSFISVSIAPPLVAFCPQKSSTTWMKMSQQKNLCINFLSENQSQLCWKFASGDIYGRFSDTLYKLNGFGVPRISGCSAWIDVVIENEIDAGDHWIVVCRITEMEKGETDLPLTFAKGRLSTTLPIFNLANDHFADWEQSINLM